MNESKVAKSQHQRPEETVAVIVKLKVENTVCQDCPRLARWGVRADEPLFCDDHRLRGADLLHGQPRWIGALKARWSSPY